jgi:hypothetical protein
MTPFPLGANCPIKMRGNWNCTWSLHWADDFTKIATFRSQYTAWQNRNAILRSLGYDA